MSNLLLCHFLHANFSSANAIALDITSSKNAAYVIIKEVKIYAKYIQRTKINQTR